MHKALHILCLEDDEEDFDIINYALKTGGLSFSSKRVDTKENFLDALTTFDPDIILSDHALPGFNSTEALELCKGRNLTIPFILVTGAVSDEFAVSCLKRGADDYILKSNLTKLPSIIENTLKQKESERARIKAAADLAKRNEQLSTINKELDSMVYSVSHNLRAPLRSLLGLVAVAKNESDVTVMKRYHEMMESSLLRLDESINEILEYSRNAKQDIKIEKIDIRKTIEENLERMQFLPGFQNIVKEILIDEHDSFFSDQYRLSLIFNNLISNSIKYFDNRKSACFIKISAVVNNDVAVIEFQDNGIGIDKKALPKIFDMFFRATDRSEGAGLGLHIVREAVEMLQGSIQVHSDIGEGTFFRIEIPNQLESVSTKQQPIDTFLINRV